MSSARASRHGACALVSIALTAAACGRPAPPPPAAQPAAAPAPSTSAATVPHGDHNPHHGGVVMMKGDLHYEVVLDPGGRCQLFFSDAVREDLPASIASSVSIVMHRPGEADETIPLEIDATGESWVGKGRSVADAARTNVRVSFTVAGEPYAIDLPFRPAPAPSGS